MIVWADSYLMMKTMPIYSYLRITNMRHRSVRYTAKASDRVKPGTVGLNNMQRKELDVTKEEMVSARQRG